jgi:hypothetical protein
MKDLETAIELLRQHLAAVEEREDLSWKGSLEKLRLRTEEQRAHNDTVAKRARWRAP